MTSTEPLSVGPPAPPTAPPTTARASPVTEEDTGALRKIKTSSVLFLVGVGVSFLIGLDTNVLTISSIMSSGTGSTATTASSASFVDLMTVVAAGAIVGGALEAASFIQLRSAFKLLSRVDAPRFSLPTRFMTVAIVSLPIAYLGLILVLAGVSSFLPSTGSVSTITSSQVISSSGFAYLIAGAIAALISGISLLVAFIGGLMLGLWRVGQRYDADTIKAGAIVFIIPIIQIVAPILVLVGVSNVSMNLEATGRAQG